MKLHDATMPPSGAARAVGSLLAGCSIEAVLHAGPVFTLYRAVQAHGGERVVLKEYCPQALCERGADGAPLLRDPDRPEAFAAFEAGRAAFVDELHTLQQLRLPGLVQVRAILETEGSLCALLPLLPGVTLDALPKPQDDPALHALLLSLLEPLAQLHAAGLVHGALHARQWLWAPGHMPVLLGFSLAAQALGLPPQDGAARAPELDPRSAHLPRGPWTDVYALAAMVLQCLTGRPWQPAEADQGAEAVAARLALALGPAREPAQRRVLVQALAAALAQAPHERPAHAGVLRELLGGSAPQWHVSQAAATGQPLHHAFQAAAAGQAPHVPPAAGHAAGEGTGARRGPRPAHAGPAGPTAAPGEAAWPHSASAGTAAGAHAAAPGDAAWPHSASPREAAEPHSAAPGDAAWAHAAPRGTEPSRVPPQLRTPRAPGAGVHPAAGWDRRVLAFAQGDGFVMPETPRQRNDHLRLLALTLLVGLGCGAMGWWVHGLWQAETERYRINRLIAQAATAQAELPAPPAPAWSAGATALPPAPPAEPAALPADAVPQPPRAEPPAPPAALADAAQGDGAPVSTPVAEVAPRGDASAASSPVLALQGAPAPALAKGEPAAAASAVDIAPAPALAPRALPDAPPPAARTATAPRPERNAKAVAPARAEPRPAGRAVAVRADTSPPRASSPRNACGALAKYALLQCMQRQCGTSLWRKHPQCQRLINDNVLSS